MTENNITNADRGEGGVLEKVVSARNLNRAYNGEEGGRRLPKGWEVPEGAEAFGHARHDLDWIDPTRR